MHLQTSSLKRPKISFNSLFNQILIALKEVTNGIINELYFNSLEKRRKALPESIS